MIYCRLSTADGGCKEVVFGKKEAERDKEDHFSLMKSSQLAPKELRRVRGELIENDVVIHSLLQVGKARKHGREQHGRKAEEMTRGRRYEILV